MVDVIVALIAVSGVLFGIVVSYVTARSGARKDLAVAKLTEEKDTLVAKLIAEKDLAIAQMKVTQDLQIEYDKNLRSERIKEYKTLWSKMDALAKYPEPPPMTVDAARDLARKFRDWYFAGGGLFMSENTREKYFDLQDGLKIVLQNNKKVGHFKEDNPDSQSLQRYLERKTVPPEELLNLANAKVEERQDGVSEEVLKNLRKLGSSLRTSMTEDLLTRRGSYLSDGGKQEP